jgi:hypothetical protein
MLNTYNERYFMGYNTTFTGKFVLDRKLDGETYTFLKKLAETRRMARLVGPEYGIEGEFYFKGKGFMGQEEDSTIIDCNRPPSTQPSLWCQWVPTEDRLGIEWDGNEKFYEYVAWIQYIIDKILAPKGYVLNGNVHFQGENEDDFGIIVARNNTITVNAGTRVYVEPEVVVQKSVTTKPKKIHPIILKRKICWKASV